MRKIFNYNTGKLYESDSNYTITVFERPLSDQVVVEPGDENVEFDQKFLSYDEALDVVDAAVDKLCQNEGFDRDAVEITETENGFLVSVPDYKEWKFVISGDVDESKKDSKEESLNESKSGKSNESVSANFSRLRSLFEAAGLNEEDEEEKKDDESSEDKKKDDEDGKEDDEKKDDEKDSEDEDSQEMKAVVITVKKGDEDKCKEELIEAGVDEDDIDILEGEEDDENIDIRIDVNSVMELKDYLDKKGIDLEEEIGGEIVSDDDDKSSDEEKDKEDDEEKDFDFNDLGDLFGADEDEK